MFVAKNTMLTLGPVVMLDSVGTGVTGKGNSTLTWTQTIASNANYLVAPVMWGISHTVSSFTVNGTAMVSAGTSVNGNYTVQIFTLLNPPTGSVSFSLLFNGLCYVAATSASYTNVTGVSSLITANANTGTASLTLGIDSPTQMGCVGFISSSSGSFGSLSGGTSRFSVAEAGLNNYASLYGDTYGTSSVDSTLSASSPGNWAAAGVILR